MARPRMIRFIVEGRGPFPLDMLRHDEAWPRTETDANIAQDAERERRSVTLLSGRVTGPTHGRWASFGWPVIGHEEVY